MLQHLFSDQSKLARIEISLHQLHILHGLLTKALPAALRPYCHSVYWADKILVANITNSTAMSKIRQLCPGLMQTLQQQGIELKKVKPVIFFEHGKSPAPPKTQYMTSAALTAFEQLQQTIGDPALKQAIAALLKAHQPKAK